MLIIQHLPKTLSSVGATVDTFADLPSAASANGLIYLVKKTTGIWPTRKHAGLYLSNGSSWTRLGVIQGLLTSSDVIDNVTSSDVDKPLSANQGGVLSDRINDKKLEVIQNTLILTTVNTGTPTTIASVTVTPRSSSNKILLLATGDGNPNQSGGWHFLRLYRDSTTLDPYIINQNAGGVTKNCPFALNTVDSPSSTSSITYTLKAFQGSGSFTYGEGGTSQAPRLIAIEFEPN